MFKRCNTASRGSVAGFALLSVLLFYVSGAALLLHVQLDHRHDLGAAAARAVEDGTRGDTHRDAPADAPKSPSKDRCQLCDMLTGSTRPLMVVQAGQPLFIAVDSYRTLVPAESPAERLSTSDISRRGPPSIG